VHLPAYVYVNGAVVAGGDAVVSVFDRGLFYGDGLFETLRAYAGRPFALAAHVERLRRSAAILGFTVPRLPWQRIVRSLLDVNGLGGADAWVRLVVTRGTSWPNLLPPPRPRPTVIAVAAPIDPALRRAQQRGVRVHLLPFAREGFLSEHKRLDYVLALLGKRLAVRRDAHEGLYVNAEGLVTEGTTSNVFVWGRRRLVTPPVTGILPGVTRRLVMELAAAMGVSVEERPLPVRQLVAAPEAFLTSSVAEIVPVIRVDAHVIGTGAVGSRTRQLYARYREVTRTWAAGGVRGLARQGVRL
jgi:branched-chain amino acid aminotransferase